MLHPLLVIFIFLLMACAGTPNYSNVNTSPIKQQMALRLAIEWLDPNHQKGINANDETVHDLLTLLNNIYLKYPDLENIPVYDYESPTHRANVYLTQTQFELLQNKLANCSFEKRHTKVERYGINPIVKTSTEWNYFITPVESPLRQCLLTTNTLRELSIVQITLLKFTDQQRLLHQVTLHSALAQDMHFIVNRILQDNLWKKLLPGIRAEELPRQQDNYESQIEIKFNSSPLLIVFKEHKTLEEQGKTQTVWRLHPIQATKNSRGDWVIVRQKPRDEIKSTSL